MFQGRYKAVVVNAEGKSGYYFRIVADYIHLNCSRSAHATRNGICSSANAEWVALRARRSVRIGWAGGTSGKRLKEYRWSSFIFYGGKRAPEWLVRDRVLRDFELSERRRGLATYASYLEARAKDRHGAMNDQSLKELRRGWYLGEKKFGERLLGLLSGEVKAKRRSGSLRGDAARAHDESEAERLVKAGMAVLGLPPGKALQGRGRQLEERTLLAALVRAWSDVSNRWVANRLSMGSESSVTRAVRRVRGNRGMKRKLLKLEGTLELRG